MMSWVSWETQEEVMPRAGPGRGPSKGMRSLPVAARVGRKVLGEDEKSDKTAQTKCQPSRGLPERTDGRGRRAHGRAPPADGAAGQNVRDTAPRRRAPGGSRGPEGLRAKGAGDAPPARGNRIGAELLAPARRRRLRGEAAPGAGIRQRARPSAAPGGRRGLPPSPREAAPAPAPPQRLPQGAGAAGAPPGRG